MLHNEARKLVPEAVIVIAALKTMSTNDCKGGSCPNHQTISFSAQSFHPLWLCRKPHP